MAVSSTTLNRTTLIFTVGVTTGILVATALVSAATYRSYSSYEKAQRFAVALAQLDVQGANRFCDPASIKVSLTNSGKLLLTLNPKSACQFDYTLDGSGLDPWIAKAMFCPQYHSLLDFAVGRVALGSKGSIRNGYLLVSNGKIVYIAN